MNSSARRGLAAAWMSLALAGCGGGGGGDAATPGSPPSAGTSPQTFGPAGPSSSFAQRCAPGNSLASATLRTGSRTIEQQWLRAYFDEAYLWPSDVPNIDPAAYASGDHYTAMDDYFNALRSPVVTDSGNRRDRFSFTLSTSDWQALSESGVEAGYGLEWSLGSKTPPRRIRVAYVQAGSPAAAAGLRRGDELVTVDGVSADVTDSIGVDRLNDALFPSLSGIRRSFHLLRGGTTLSISMTSASVTKTPVPIRTVQTLSNGQRVGYVLFTDHILTAEAPLIDAVNDFKAQGVSELVLDLRYNGGGYLFIASELARMIAPPERTTGATFESLRYNSKRSAENKVTPFYDTSCIAAGGRCSRVAPLPSLGLKRVYVLTQSGTCSASEAIINGLRGVDVEVVLIGGKTCGKPYGFTARDNCGISYLPIEFSGVNAKGFGDYADGFQPGTGATARFVPGCTVDDDFSRALGDPLEGQLAAALGHAVTGQCPARASGSSSVVKAMAAIDAAPMQLRRHPLRDNRVLSPAR